MKFNTFVIVALSIFLFSLASAQSDQFGIVSNMEDNTKANLVDNLGVGWVRLTAYWKNIETSKGVFNWSAFDAQVNRATSRNLKMFITIHETPSWANGGQGPNVPPNNAVDFGDFCFAIANRYKSNNLVKAYGMWNEPNLSGFWSGTKQQYQTRILAPGSQKIHQAKSSLLVAAPEVSHHWTNGSTWNLGTLLDTSGAQIDVATVHFYPDWSPNILGFDTYLDNYVKPNRRNKPVWVTEISHYGCPSNVCSLDDQAHYYTYIVNSQATRSSWFTKIFPYRVWDPQGSCSNGNGMGITYGSGHTQKPAYRTYKDKISNLPFFDPYPDCHPLPCTPHDPDCWPPPQ